MLSDRLKNLYIELRKIVTMQSFPAQIGHDITLLFNALAEELNAIDKPATQPQPETKEASNGNTAN